MVATAFENTDYAPGMRVIIRDEEWMIKKVETNAQSGTFKRTITDDTQPGGSVERTIEYVAPFDRCDREQDYETAWRFFEEKYGKAGE
jgi:hypothetical protein